MEDKKTTSEKGSVLWSAISNVLVYGLAIGAVAFHGIGVILNHLTGGHEYFQPGRIFSETVSSFEMKQERKNLKDKVKMAEEKSESKDEKKETTKEKSSKKKIDQASIKDQEKKMPQGEKKETVMAEKVASRQPQLSESIPLAPEDLLPRSNESSMNIQLLEIEQKIDQLIQGTIQNKENRDFIVSELLSQPEVKKVFDNLQLYPVSQQGDDKVFFFSKQKEMDLSCVPVIEKEDLLKGDASRLASVIHTFKNPSQAVSVESAAEALLSMAKIKTELLSYDLNSIRKSLTIDQPERYTIANTICEDGNNYGLLYAALSYKENCVDLYYKDSYVATVDLSAPISQAMYEIKQRVSEINTEKDLTIYQIGPISFQKSADSLLSVTIHGETREFPVKEEFDLKPIADYIQEKCPEKEETANIDAMMMGLAVNPYIERSVDENEIEMNPFTGEQKFTGNLVIGHQNGLQYICEQQLCEQSLGRGYIQKPIVCIEPYGASANFEKMEEQIVQYRKEHPLEEYDEQFLTKNSFPDLNDNTTIAKSIDCPKLSNGYNVWNQMKEKSVLEGIDIPEIKFAKHTREDPEEEYYYEEFCEYQEEEIGQEEKDL